MKDEHKDTKQAALVKLVTAQPKKLETKASLSRPNPYTTDFTDMSDMTRRQLQSGRNGGSKP